MAILPITVLGEPVLQTVAAQVTEFDAALEDFVADMVETMDAAHGVGLAAPQVGVGKQVFVWRYEGVADYDEEFFPDLDLPADASKRVGVIINPKLVLSDLREGELDEELDAEGCLSIPGIYYPVRRYNDVVLEGQDVKGNPVRLDARGWLGRIWQHEYDHLQGVLFTDRLEEPYLSQAKAEIEEAGYGEPGLIWDPSEQDFDEE
ncbi:MAG: peptide deformylase [Buchananella hordeovulneris]|nr:peptide deformylase [Buchananella hordeovulneris]